MMIHETLDSVARTTGPARNLEGAGGILVLGILSIPLSGGFVGLILAYMALSRSKSALNLYKDYPDQYTDSSYRKVKAGRTCAIVSLSLWGIAFLIVLIATSMS